MVRIEGYDIEAPIGAGGMASVYRARQIRVANREVALKILDPDLLARDPDFKARFKRETELIAAFNHTNIVTVYDAGDYEGQFYLAMELLRGGTLSHRVRDGRLRGRPAVLKVIRGVANALAQAHEQSIVHRDVKPDNILFRTASSEEPVLVDFGIAKGFEQQADITQVTSVIGSPNYMSPEQALAQKRLTGKSDVFSLGVVFYRLLTGRYPFDAEGVGQLALAHRDQPPLPLPPEHAELQPLMNAMLEIDIARRASAEDVIAAIDELQEETLVIPTLPREESTRRFPWAAALGVAAVILAGAASYQFVYLPSQSPADVAQPAGAPAVSASAAAATAPAADFRGVTADQLRAGLTRKTPAYLQLEPLDRPPFTDEQGQTFSHRWRAYAPGYQSEQLSVREQQLPSQLALRWNEKIAPAQFYDYQAVLAEPDKAQRFRERYPESLFAPITRLLDGDAASELAQITQYAEGGDAVAQFQLGEIYELGVGVPVALDKAQKWSQAAAQHGYLPGEFQWLVFGRDADALSEDDDEFVAKLEKISERDVFLAKRLLAGIFIASKDAARQLLGVELFRQAARSGDPGSHRALASLYRRGDIVPSDEELAKFHEAQASTALARLL